MACVPKAKTKDIRICGDFTELNKSVLRLVHPLSKIDVYLAKLKNARFFSRLSINPL